MSDETANVIPTNFVLQQTMRSTCVSLFSGLGEREMRCRRSDISCERQISAQRNERESESLEKCWRQNLHEAIKIPSIQS